MVPPPPSLLVTVACSELYVQPQQPRPFRFSPAYCGNGRSSWPTLRPPADVAVEGDRAPGRGWLKGYARHAPGLGQTSWSIATAWLGSGVVTPFGKHAAGGEDVRQLSSYWDAA